MKTVFENRMVAHVWAQQSQSEGRSNNGQFYFRGKTIFSYRDSWPLATFINANEILLNVQRYSRTTSNHLGYVRRALKSDIKIWAVDRDIIANPAAFLKLTPKKREKFLADQAAKEESALKAYKKDQAKRNREIKKAEKAGAIVALIKWRNREELSYGENRLIQKHQENEVLRLKDDKDIETSKGATFPISHAKRIFPKILECKTKNTSWHKNGSTIKIGLFQLDAIAENGDVKAGCHDIQWEEIERMAKILNIA